MDFVQNVKSLSTAAMKITHLFTTISFLEKLLEYPQDIFPVIFTDTNVLINEKIVFF